MPYIPNDRCSCCGAPLTWCQIKWREDFCSPWCKARYYADLAFRQDEQHQKLRKTQRGFNLLLPGERVRSQR